MSKSAHHVNFKMTTSKFMGGLLLLATFGEEKFGEEKLSGGFIGSDVLLIGVRKSTIRISIQSL